MKNFRSLYLFLTALEMAASSLTAAPIDIYLDRTKERFNLGLSDFKASDRRTDTPSLQELESTLSQDLLFSRLFNLIENGPKIEKRSDISGWSVLGSDVVLSASVRTRSDGDVTVSVKLFDTRSTKEVFDFNKKGHNADLRGLGHEISNEVVRYFTGQPGIFTSKIVFVNDATGRKELYIADYNGKNMKRLTNDNSIVILPRLSPDGSKIIFTSYKSGNPDLYLINRAGSGRIKLSAKAGLNVSPSWSPNNNELAVTLSYSGPPNIYLMDTQGAVKGRLTDSQGADTAPTFSPDGGQIAFTSDRAGAPHIYIVGLDGSGLRRMTTASHCDSAAWSPDGQTLLYVKGDGHRSFDIYAIEVLTGVERRLTWGQGDSENPSWSPDGRFILFASNRRGKYELYIMMADGSDPQVVSSNNGQSFTPHWSN